MDIQTEITWRMRGILVDWLIEIHTSFRLLPETIFLAINIVDRFCATQVVSLVKYQLMGITALFIAAKYEEVVCPSVSNFLYMTDGGYSDDELLKAERWVLQMIGWDLSYPNPLNYLRRISKADDYDNQCRTVAKYFLEMSCVDRHLLAYPPSVLAAASAWLARKVLDRGEWVRFSLWLASRHRRKLTSVRTHTITRTPTWSTTQPTARKSCCPAPKP